jgi:hypothetical protein
MSVEHREGLERAGDHDDLRYASQLAHEQRADTRANRVICVVLAIAVILVAMWLASSELVGGAPREAPCTR